MEQVEAYNWSVWRNKGPLCTARSRWNCSWGICLCSVVIGVVFKFENTKASECVERRVVRLAHWQVGPLVLVLSYTTRLLTLTHLSPLLYGHGFRPPRDANEVLAKHYLEYRTRGDIGRDQSSCERALISSRLESWRVIESRIMQRMPFMRR